MKRIKLFQLVQGPLVVVALGIILNLAFRDTSMALNMDQIVSIPVAEGFSEFVGLFTLPDFSHIGNPQVWITGITIAVVASLETLLCLEATDKLDPLKRVSPANQELKAQAIGNMLSGLIGGLPVTQVIVRSSVNIQSGGQTKMSAILHGFILLFCAMVIPVVLNLIPLASLAAILFLVGYKLARPAKFKKMYNLGWSSFVPFMATILGIVFTDLLVGIGIGLAVAIVYLLRNNYKVPFLFEKEDHSDPNSVIRLELSEEVSFLNKANIQRALSTIPNGSKVVIDASKSIHIDPDVIEIVEEFEIHAKQTDIELTIIERKRKGMKESPFKLLEDHLKVA